MMTKRTLPKLLMKENGQFSVSSQGRFLWYELATTDVEAAKAFYATVVGWDTQLSLIHI